MAYNVKILPPAERFSRQFLSEWGNRHRDLRHAGCGVVADDVVDKGDLASPRYAISLLKAPRRLSTVNATTQMTADRIDPHGEAMPMGNNVSE